MFHPVTSSAVPFRQGWHTRQRIARPHRLSQGGRFSEQTLENLVGDIRYALRHLWAARVFTITAVLTLALGLGGTTAIFTLIHAVMLRSLPVSDPSRLYRIGDGNNCCVQGGPQDRWGMFSYPLFERLKAELPEFEEIAAFQAGARASERETPGVDTSSRPLRSEYVTGNYFSTLGVNALGGRILTPADDTPSAPPPSC
jgi:hypothetical protein